MTSLLLLCIWAAGPGPADSLRAAILSRIQRDSGASVAVVLSDPVSGFFVAVHPDQRFHAASTMKVPVLLELGRRIDARDMHWADSIPVKNQFASIVDGSFYSLDAARVTRTIRALGADSMLVLRGVEDGKAYAQGLNNTTTARDLATLLLAIAGGNAVGRETTAELLDMLEAQEFNDGIPGGLPPGTRVAHKTGEITATWHDAALVYPEGSARPYATMRGRTP